MKDRSKCIAALLCTLLLCASCSAPRPAYDARVETAAAGADADPADEEKHTDPGLLSVYTGRERIIHTYAYELLDEDLKTVYDRISEAVSEGRESVSFDDCVRPTFEQVEYIYKLIHNDDYRLLGTTNRFRYRTDKEDKVCELRFEYLYDKEKILRMRTELRAAADKILSGLSADMSDYDIVLYIHDSIIDRTRYADSRNENNAYGALVEKKAKCQGYSKAFCYLCAEAGIPSLTVLGTTDTEHMWNEAEIEGSYCHFDLTWDDPDDEHIASYVKYDYFGLTDEEIENYRSIEGNIFTLPECADDSYDYYTYNLLRVTSYDEAKALILKGYDSKKKMNIIQMKSDEESFTEITEALFGTGEKGIRSFLKEPGKRIDYVINSKNHVIKLFISSSEK